MARADLEDIAQYTYERYGEGQLEVYLAAIHHGLALIAENPALGHIREDIPELYRAIQIEHHIIIYQARDHKVYVARILHKKRNLSQHQIEDR